MTVEQKFNKHERWLEWLSGTLDTRNHALIQCLYRPIVPTKKLYIYLGTRREKCKSRPDLVGKETFPARCRVGMQKQFPDPDPEYSGLRTDFPPAGWEFFHFPSGNPVPSGPAHISSSDDKESTDIWDKFRREVTKAYKEEKIQKLNELKENIQMLQVES